MGRVDLLLLTDGRAPVGAYAHSFGLEAAVLAGDVVEVDDLEAFVAARLATVGRVDATAAAAVRHRCAPTPHPVTGPPSGPTTGSTTGTTTDAGWLRDADDEVAARLAAPALRDASRALGRHLLRLARRTWPDGRLEALAADRPGGWHQPVVLGVVGAVVGADVRDVAVASLYGLASGLASAGLRLLGLDPIEVHALQARAAPLIERHAATAATAAAWPLDRLPATGTPLADLRAQHHAAAAASRLFAS